MTGRIVSAYFWGVVADRYGRRPVIVVSLGSTAGFAAAFGVSTTFFWAFFFRYQVAVATVYARRIHRASCRSHAFHLKDVIWRTPSFVTVSAVIMIVGCSTRVFVVEFFFASLHASVARRLRGGQSCCEL